MPFDVSQCLLGDSEQGFSALIAKAGSLAATSQMRPATKLRRGSMVIVLADR